MERQYVAIDLHLRRSLIVRENEAGEELNREHETRVDVLFKGVGAMQLPSVMAALTAMRCRFPVREPSASKLSRARARAKRASLKTWPSGRRRRRQRFQASRRTWVSTDSTRRWRWKASTTTSALGNSTRAAMRYGAWQSMVTTATRARSAWLNSEAKNSTADESRPGAMSMTTPRSGSENTVA